MEGKNRYLKSMLIIRSSEAYVSNGFFYANTNENLLKIK